MSTPPDLEPLTQERRRRQTRDQLLRAAAQVFSERGFYGASLDEVAAAAGFTKGAVYSNFKSKEDLFLALLEAHSEREQRAVKETIEASEVPPEFRLSDFVALVREQFDLGGSDFGALFQEFCAYAMRNPAARERLVAFFDMQVDAERQVLESQRPRGGNTFPEPARDVARIIVALFNGIGTMRSLDPDSVDDAFLESALSFLARALLSAQ